MIYSCTQIDHLRRPKIPEVKELLDLFESVIGGNRNAILGKLFDYRNFANGPKTEYLRRAWYTKIASSTPLEPMVKPRVRPDSPEFSKQQSMPNLNRASKFNAAMPGTQVYEVEQLAETEPSQHGQRKTCRATQLR